MCAVPVASPVPATTLHGASTSPNPLLSRSAWVSKSELLDAAALTEKLTSRQHWQHEGSSGMVRHTSVLLLGCVSAAWPWLRRQVKQQRGVQDGRFRVKLHAVAQETAPPVVEVVQKGRRRWNKLSDRNMDVVDIAVPDVTIPNVRNIVVISGQRLPVSPLVESLSVRHSGASHITSADVVSLEESLREAARFAIMPAIALDAGVPWVQGDDWRHYLLFKPQATTFKVKQPDSQEEVVVNLIDITGHNGRLREVLAVLDTCQGAILAVDGTEGVDAPALFTAAQALKKGLPLIPVLLRSRGSCQSVADVAADLEKVLGLKAPETGKFLECSRHAASRKDFEAIFSTLIERVPVAEEKEEGNKLAPLPLPEEGHELKPIFYMLIFPELPARNLYKDLRYELRGLKMKGHIRSITTIESRTLGGGFSVGITSIFQAHALKQWLEKDKGLNPICVPPSVVHEVVTKGKRAPTKRVFFSTQLPEKRSIEEVKEPFALTLLTLPEENVDACMDVLHAHRGMWKKTTFLSRGRLLLQYEMPLAELCGKIHAELKECSPEVALAYKVLEWRSNDIAALDIYAGKTHLSELCRLIHRSQAMGWSRMILSSFTENMPPQLLKYQVIAYISGTQLVYQNIPAVRVKPFWRREERKKKYRPLTRMRRTQNEKILRLLCHIKRKKQKGRIEVPRETIAAVLEGCM